MSTTGEARCDQRELVGQIREFAPAVRFQEPVEAADVEKYVRNSDEWPHEQDWAYCEQLGPETDSKVKAGFINHL